MMQQNNNIDKTLRQLEGQSLPDLSKMDEHWQQMKTQLQSSSQPGNRSHKSRRMIYLIAAAMIGILFFVFYAFILNNKFGTIKEADVIVANPIQAGADTGSLVQQPGDIPAANIPKKDIIIIPRSVVTKTQNDPDPVIVAADTNAIPVPVPYKMTLEDFFGQLEKPSQEFVIDNERDTVIHGMDGSAFLVAANTFDSKGFVTIIVKEFYSYKDIITNRLSTVSDNNQLITGGMIHIMAMEDGKEININPGKAIRWFIPDTTQAMKSMQLFTGVQQQGRQSRIKMAIDSMINWDQRVVEDTASSAVFNTINWVPQNRFFNNNYIQTVVKVLDLRDEPLKTFITGNSKKGVFRVAHDSKISNEELKARLKEKYNYRKVRLKRTRESFPFSRYRRIVPGGEPVGDSAWVAIRTAALYKLMATDTASFMVRGFSSNSFTAGEIAASNYFTKSITQLSKRFSVDIQSLGWINCDRFLNDNRPKIGFAVNLEDTASNYFTMLVFERIKSMIPGVSQGNQVLFAGLPEGETARVISVGIRDGKPIAASKTIQLSRNAITQLSFEETSPSAFKEEAAKLDE